jgi:hypothetical protein
MSSGEYSAKLSIITGFVLAFIVGCTPSTTPVLEREARFELGIGRLEDELGLFSRNGVLPKIPNTVTMRDGMIYIGNGTSNKVMGFTSFGDLVRLIYEPRKNPRPVTLGEPVPRNGDALLTRRAVSFSFNRLGRIAVDSKRTLYAEDLLPRERAVWDDSLEVYLNRIMLRFDGEGNPVDYIGQEGIGGTPFPSISRIEITPRDELVVVTDTNKRRMLFVYSPGGELITTVEIERDRLPVPEIDAGYVPILNDTVIGADAARVYVMVSYYRALGDPATGRDQGIGFDHARVYWVDMHTGRYEGFVELPRETAEGTGEQHFQLLGIARGEHLFLLSRVDETNSQLVIMNDRGRVLRRRFIQILERDLVVRSFHLSSEGVLTALLGYPDRAHVVWWRSDRLLPQ